MALDPVYYPKVGGVRVDKEKRKMTKEQKDALKVARDALRAANPKHSLSDDQLPLDACAAFAAAYLEARKDGIGRERGQLVRYAIDDEILDLCE